MLSEFWINVSAGGCQWRVGMEREGCCQKRKQHVTSAKRFNVSSYSPSH